MSNPLIDTLFRPTTVGPSLASAAPVRPPGVRSRAGNAMNRTRAALLVGAAEAVAASGSRITMAQVAATSGVAKATLYNHFRTREAVLDGLLAAEVDALIGQVSGLPLTEALAAAASAVSAHPVRAALAQLEPQTLARLARITGDGGWARVREAVTDALAADGRGGAALVVRWLASFLVAPADAETIRADVATLFAGLPAAAPVELTA